MKQDLLVLQTLRLLVFLILTTSSTACARLPRRYIVEDPSSTSSQRGQLLDINQASAGELAYLPGIGKIMAERIVDHRARYGNFRRIEHLMMVRGISERKFREVSSLIQCSE